MPKIKQFKDNDNNTTYDIYGQNVVDISYDDYQNLSEEQKNADIAYHIYNVPEDQTEPTNTVSGSIVSFDDGSAQPLKSLKVAINPVQDLHGYDTPWLAGGGKNKFDPSAFTWKKWHLQGNVFGTLLDSNPIISFTVNGSESVSITNTLPYYGIGVVVDAVDYDRTASLKESVGGAIQFWSAYEDGATRINTGSTSCLIPANTSGFLAIRKDTTDAKTAFVQVEIGSTASEWSPYSNICPISGWTGANINVTGINIWDEQWEVGSLNNITGEKVSSSTVIRSKNYIPVCPNTQYYFTTTKGFVLQYDKDKNYIGVLNSRNSTPTDKNCYYLLFRLNSEYGTTYNNDISINYPSTDTNYHAYNGTTYPITWSEAGEVFGGYIDVTSGKLIKDKLSIDLSTLNWTKIIIEGGITYFRSSSFSRDKGINFICSQYVKVVNRDALNNQDNSISRYSSSTYYICIRDDSKASLTESQFKEAMEGVQLVYQAETAIEYTLSNLPQINTLLGNNNIWSDTGEILECVYVPSLLTQIRYNEKVYATPSYAPKAGDANTVSGHTVETDVPSDAVFTDTTYESKTPAEGGTDLSLVTTGEKWRWNNKSDLSTIAPPYDPLKSYKYGDFTSYDNILYSCISPTTGTWDSTKWRSVTVGEILANLRGVIAPVMDINSVADMVQKDELLDVLDYGDQLVIPWFDGTTEYELPFNFCHLETVKDENDNDVKVADFEAEYVLPTDCIFDASEAIYASANDLAAGDYYFKIANDAWGNNNGKYVCFTLADTLTAGKQIRKKSGAYNAAIENCTLGIYTDGTDTAGTALSFTVETEEPSTGTSLGQTDGSGDLNHWHCVALGYNRYKYSAVRQYLNADAVKNTWWVQQHKWDVMPAYATTKDGFLYGLSADVKARLKTTKIVTARNTVFNSGDTPLGDMDITYDKVFLIGLEQSYISPQVEGEGEAWEYYKLLNGTSTPYQRSSTYADLIKYGIDAKRTARYRWLRSCLRGLADHEWYVYSSGYVISNNASNAYRVAPCLRIG